MVAFDLTILNDNAQKLGYLVSDCISPVVINDVLTPAGDAMGQMSMPVEFWLTADGTKTLMVLRGGVSQMRTFAEEFKKFIVDHGFSSVALLTAGVSPLMRERHSNIEVPEIFAYSNKHLEDKDFYNKQGIRKYGWWIDPSKYKKAHAQLKELGAGGWSARLFKTLEKLDMPVSLFPIICCGKVDFIGGFAFYQFIKKPVFDMGAGLSKISDVNLAESHGCKSGQEVHELMFQSGKIKHPQGWDQIFAYF
jgi:hypothetical protein